MATLPKGIGCKRVGTLTTAKRKRLPVGAFGLPAQRKYPLPDPSHAKNAKARAWQQVVKGKLSLGDYTRIVNKANRVIAFCPLK